MGYGGMQMQFDGKGCSILASVPTVWATNVARYVEFRPVQQMRRRSYGMGDAFYSGIISYLRGKKPKSGSNVAAH